MTDILCPTDFTAAADTALAYATDIAARTGGSITLLHVLEKHHRTEDPLATASALMDESARDAMQRVTVNEVFREGDPLKQIIAESKRDHALMVAGTHGAHGLRQSLLGADILKLVRHVSTTSLIVQQHSVPRPIERIVMPVAGHADISNLLNGVCFLARLYKAEVIVYQMMRPGEQPSERLLDNKRIMLERLSREGATHQDVAQPSTVFSVGFAEQTIRYADEVKAGCIAIMAKASDDYRWIADAEKERLLANAPGIPVLCAL